MTRQTIAEFLKEKNGGSIYKREFREKQSCERKKSDQGFRPAKPRTYTQEWTDKEILRLTEIMESHCESEILTMIRIIKDQWN